MRRSSLLLSLILALALASMHCVIEPDQDLQAEDTLAQTVIADAGLAKPCPYVGHITYTLARAAQPTAAQRDAYAKIAAAMDKALRYYNCHANITKALQVSYVPSVATADGNINGQIRFGAPSTFEYTRAMHEIAHTVGIGTASTWPSMLSNGIFTGAQATRELRAITGKPDEQVHGDAQHFWPYGLNYAREVTSEADPIAHCRMVVAIRKDLGLQR